MSLLKNKIMIGLAVVALAGLAWYGMAGSGPAPLLMTDTPTTASDQDLIATLLTLRAVTLSGTIFVDPAFTSLIDFGKEIVPEPVGRQNPFAPLSSTVRQADGTTQDAPNHDAAQIFAKPKQQ